MNFKTHTKRHDDFSKRVILSKKDMGDLERKSSIQGSFEIDHSQKNYETITGLDRFNPKAVDPNSLDRFNPKAVELDQGENTSMPELPTFSPTLGFDIPENPIEDEILKSGEQLGPNPEELNANDLIDTNDFSNLDDLLGQIDNLEDLMQEIMNGGTHHQQAPTEGGGVNAAEELGDLYDASEKIDGLFDDHDFDCIPNWRDGDWWFGNEEEELQKEIDEISSFAEDDYTPSGSEGTESDGDGDNWDPNDEVDLDQPPYDKLFPVIIIEEGDDGAEDGDDKPETTSGKDDKDEGDKDEEGDNGAEGDIMVTGNEDDLPPWVHHFDDITGQEDFIPEVSTIEIPLHESTNHLKKSGQTINQSPELLAKDGVSNHDHNPVTMKSAFTDNGEFIIEAIPSAGETYRAEGLFPCPTIPHIQAKNFSELIPTISMTTIQDI
ncbi:hypothetical protein PMIT1313_01283 [Prochlorococcus marinus str. MIT 1313]|uniref:hypothetical protein n=1 Tax=Prochlorococcus TaxID=1218 RepID=UPI0007B39F58|nr:hypothetical protein [Prochlorococcus marinus]KZR69595.1 hypothetical protein PMIT1313_01283 [Prochlorococcus marinus str. MIT 1313]KZR72457.1 hypothetical protein PMIT1318_00971 [Prochlorococcus marinus str. MIT 1318]